MNKKFLNAVLFGALLASSTGTFTSCKDYDDDINGLSERVDAVEKTLADLNTKSRCRFNNPMCCPHSFLV